MFAAFFFIAGIKKGHIKSDQFSDLSLRYQNRSLKSSENPSSSQSKIKEATVLEKKTKPHVLYTEAGLLSAMESDGKEIENEDERKALQNIGIGTPATGASIIETLFTRNYIQR